MATLRLNQITFDADTQMRDGLNGDTVADYRDAMKNGDKFPPLVVFFDGSDYWLGDGYHRWHAANEAGLAKIECDIRKGSRRDAILFACGANGNHGLRRTNADKRRAAVTLLKDSEWSQWSDNAIANACGVSQPFVRSIREQVITVISSKQTNGRRKGSDGKKYPARHASTQQEFASASDEHESNQGDGDAQEDSADYEPQSELKTKPVGESNYFARFKALWAECDAIARAAIVTFVNDYGR